MSNYVLIFGSLLLLSFAACKKDGNAPAGNGSIRLNFENVAGERPLKLGTESYINAHGDSFTVNLYKYYVSNIRLVKSDETFYAEPESYHLIDQGDESSYSFDIAEVPAGEYSGIELLLGVDSARNVSGAQTGDLDPAKGMFWTWSTGYIMAKVEGKSPQSGSPGKGIIFHLGGYSGRYSPLKKVYLPFPAPLNISDSQTPSVWIQSDILKWFYGAHTIDFSTTYSVMEPGSTSRNIADNYAAMLSLKKVEQ